MNNNCSHLQQSLEWCMGTPELPGIRRRIFYIAKNMIARWPSYNRDGNQRTRSASLVGSFVLVADAKWKYIDILADKSQLTSDAQGEIPSQTQLNKLTAVHPGVGPEATAAACYLNNSDNVFIVEDMKGHFRVVGSDKWITKTTVAQDNGQGPTGTTSTTITVEATDEVPAPFYFGTIATEDGDIDCSDANSGNNGGNTSGNTSPNTSGNNGGNNGGNTSGGGSSSSSNTYNNQVTINGNSYNVSGGSVSITGPLTSMRFSGSNMEYLSFQYSNVMEEEIAINNYGTAASWSGNISGPVTVYVMKGVEINDELQTLSWFTINVNPDDNSGGSADE